MTLTATHPPAVHLPEEHWAQAVQCLRAASQVGLVCHVAPDGDGLGSMLALALALETLGVPAGGSWPDAETGLPQMYRFLPGQHLLVSPAAFPARPDVLVVLDTGSRERLGELAPVLLAAGTVLVLDHHAHSDGLPGVQLVDRQAAATAVIAEELIRRLGVTVDRDIATCVYTGLTTDTGSFRYSATTPAVHLLAARLLETGIRHDLIARAVWDTNPFQYLQLLGRLLDRLALEPEAAAGRGLVWTHATAAELAAHGLRSEQIEAAIDVVRTAAEAEVAVVGKQGPDGAYRMSLRSKGAVDVGAVCARLGGGGHRFAAGYTAGTDIEATMAALRQQLADSSPS